MKVKAKMSFAGKVSMYEGEVRELEESSTLTDLIACGYVELENEKVAPVQQKTTRRGAKKGESK